jgi:hypothetical protein
VPAAQDAQRQPQARVLGTEDGEERPVPSEHQGAGSARVQQQGSVCSVAEQPGDDDASRPRIARRGVAGAWRLDRVGAIDGGRGARGKRGESEPHGEIEDRQADAHACVTVEVTGTSVHGARPEFINETVTMQYNRAYDLTPMRSVASTVEPRPGRGQPVAVGLINS